MFPLRSKCVKIVLFHDSLHDVLFRVVCPTSDGDSNFLWPEVVKRIDNPALRKRFLESSVFGCGNTRILLHTTGQYQCESIALTGFDLSNSRGGLLGPGAYFACECLPSHRLSASNLPLWGCALP